MPPRRMLDSTQLLDALARFELDYFSDFDCRGSAKVHIEAQAQIQMIIQLNYLNPNRVGRGSRGDSEKDPRSFCGLRTLKND